VEEPAGQRGGTSGAFHYNCGMRRLLIVGCGDVGMRLVPLLRDRYRVYALTRSCERHALLRMQGVVPLSGDLDDAGSLARLAGLPHDVLHLAPPPSRGEDDVRTANLIRALQNARSIPQRIIYISTSGVYGDCAGAVVHEHDAVHPQTDRARRRADAERRLREWGRRAGVRVVILRVPGIYAADRLPLERLRSATPVIHDADDAYSNHIHADDLAGVVVAALARGRSQRVYNASDGAALKMGQYFDLVARSFGLPPPPRVSRAQAEAQMPAVLLSFLRESRRLDNARLRRELRVQLKYPSVHEGVAAAARSDWTAAPARPAVT
jgi:nucleoside-diphosphate-sugar epimerase